MEMNRVKDEVVTCDICGKLLASTHDEDLSFYTLFNSVNLTYIYGDNHDTRIFNTTKIRMY